MKPVVYHPSAQKELVAAAQYYETAADGLGQRFLDQVEFCVADIAESPERWPFFLMNTRRRVLEIFPYTLVYLVEVDRIYILAVMHQKRRPGYWKKRLSQES